MRDTLPVTATRRIGEACETAQNSVSKRHPDWPVTLIVRFESERQKLLSAVQPDWSHWLRTSIAPLMVTSRGEAPRPATSVEYPTCKVSGSVAEPYVPGLKSSA